jgi:dTDP-4-dehydrorhamnose reductase
MKIAVIGADGQLGSDLMKTLCRDDVIPLFFPDFDITRPDETRQTLDRLGVDVVINTAAFHRVDECEDNPATSFLVNSVAVRDLALAARELGFALVHFSTDYVFDGRKGSPYVEEDPPHPLNVYGVSKLAGEFFVRNILKKYYLIRTCGLYGEASSREKGYNFVDKIIALEKEKKPLCVVRDQWVTPTSSAELAQRVSELIRTSNYGLFHMTNEGQCSWYEFAREIFRLMGKDPCLEPVDSLTFKVRAQRPLYSVLENRRAKSLGLTGFSPWPEALEAYLRKKGYLS